MDFCWSDLLFLQSSPWSYLGPLTGLAVLIAIIFDAVSDPIMGSISDRFISKLGRRHPFMFAAPFPTVIAIYLMFFPPDGLSEYGLFGWLIFSTILLRLSITLFAVPHLALGAELSDDYFERSRVMSLQQSFWIYGRSLSCIYLCGF